MARTGTAREILPLVSRQSDSPPTSVPPTILTIESTSTATDEEDRHSGDSLHDGETEPETAKLTRYETPDEELHGFSSDEEQHDERASGEWSGRTNALVAPSEMRGGERRSSHSLTKGQKRRVYGGGIHNQESGQFGLVEVAFMIFSETSVPSYRTALSRPLTVNIAALVPRLSSWLTPLPSSDYRSSSRCSFSSESSPGSPTSSSASPRAIQVLGELSVTPTIASTLISRRRSWPALASAVFPHRFKLHRLGEIGVSLLVIFCALGRSVVSTVISAEIGCDLFYSVIGEHRPSSSRPTAIGLITASWVRRSLSHVLRGTDSLKRSCFQ